MYHQYLFRTSPYILSSIRELITEALDSKPTMRFRVAVVAENTLGYQVGVLELGKDRKE